MLVMDKDLEPQSMVGIRDPMGTKTGHGEKSNQYAGAGTLRRHVHGHNKEKSKKCSQCDYASSHAGHLRTHMKTHSGEKSNKCNQCDYASSQAGNLRTHLKTHSGEKVNKTIKDGDIAPWKDLKK